MLENNLNNYCKYKVSIIVPCYNTNPWLDDCLQSLVDQTLQDIEIICVNDGSTDGTGERLDEWQAQYPNKIKVIHQQNGGLSNARNTGMAIAQGKCIGFVDSDDFVDVCMYDKLYKVLVDNSADIAKCQYLLFTRKKNIIKKQKQKTYSIIDNAIEYFFCGWHFNCSCLYKKQFLHQNHITFEQSFRLDEDLIFSYEVAISLPKLVVISNPMYYYRQQRKNQITRLNGKELYTAFILFQYLENKEIIKFHNKNLINKILLRRKLSLLALYTLRIQYKYKKDFLFKSANAVFDNKNYIFIYKSIIKHKYRNLISYLFIPVFTILLHCCYLWQKIVFKKNNIFNKKTKGK